VNDRPSAGSFGASSAHDPTAWTSEGSADLLGAKREPLLFSLDHQPIKLEEVADRGKGRRPPRPARSWWAGPGRWAALALLTAGLGLAAWYTMARPARVEPAAPRNGRIRVETRPAGATVVIDGAPRGITPLVVSLTPGRHDVQVSAGGDLREIPVTITDGDQLSQYIEFQVAPQTGRLQIDSDPPGARILLDGEVRGVAPLVLDNVRPGSHAVVVQSDLASVERQVTVEAGASASLFVPLAPRGAPISGWITASAPVELQMFEGGRLIGSTLTEKIMVAAGRHEIEFVNDTLGYHAVRGVMVLPGRTIAIPIDLPNGVLSINATPWAEVWIDGKRAGETPLGNLTIPIGPHEILFRHPQLGEQRHAVTVTLAAPARLSVNLRRQQ
jgi:hypothetical protein